MNRLLKLSLAALVIGTLAYSVNAAPATSAKDGASLVDQAEDAGTKAAPAKKEEVKQEASAEKSAPETKKPACDPVPEEDSSSVPVVPIVFSAISTIAFIVLAIIF